jgi:hypothetical protein
MAQSFLELAIAERIRGVKRVKHVKRSSWSPSSRGRASVSSGSLRQLPRRSRAFRRRTADPAAFAIEAGSGRAGGRPSISVVRRSGLAALTSPASACRSPLDTLRGDSPQNRESCLPVRKRSKRPSSARITQAVTMPITGHCDQPLYDRVLLGDLDKTLHDRVDLIGEGAETCELPPDNPAGVLVERLAGLEPEHPGERPPAASRLRRTLVTDQCAEPLLDRAAFFDQLLAIPNQTPEITDGRGRQPDTWQISNPLQVGEQPGVGEVSLVGLLPETRDRTGMGQAHAPSEPVARCSARSAAPVHASIATRGSPGRRSIRRRISPASLGAGLLISTRPVRSMAHSWTPDV